MMPKFPPSLAVYSSNRCNRACPHCYVAINPPRRAALDFPRLKKGLDYFISRAPAAGRRVLFLGGEPLLDYPLIRKAVEHLRSTVSGPLALYLFTNGTLLDQERADFLISRRVKLIVSPPPDMLRPQALRCAPDDRRIKAWQAILARADRADFAANFVFTPGSAAGILRNVDFLYRIGFRKIGFAPDVTSLWTPRDLRRLKTALTGFARYYHTLLADAADIFEISNMHEPLAAALGRRPAARLRCEHLVLAADGRFYACDKMLSLPFKALRGSDIGSPKTGVDLGLRQKHFQEALKSARSMGGSHGAAGYCPVGVYSLWKLKSSGSDAELSARLESFRQVSRILWGGLYRLARGLKNRPRFLNLHNG